MNVAQRWRLRAETAAWRLDQPHVLRWAMWLVPLGIGLLSMLMGQDSNWDLRNYHMYNPFAWLNGKIGLDLAPAQMQSYFNPTIDLVHYGLAKALPTRAVSFVMGLLHGLNFLLLVGIARAMLPPDASGARVRLPLLLALAGMFAAGFLAQLGNTMGDNLTALCVLGALLVLLRRWDALAQGAPGSAAAALLAGVVLGLGVGLKLTNGIYAPALCLALLLLPGRPGARVRAAFLFGVGVLAGVALTGGHWFWTMWTTFGNPLFPQFNNIFHAPLAGPVAVGDLRFVPRNLADVALWPFVIAGNPLRASEIVVSLLVWPVLYVAFLALALKTLRRRAGAAVPPPARQPDRTRMLLAFVALAYLTWLGLFGIARYLVPLELLAPLVLWLIAHRLFPHKVAAAVATLAIGAIVAAGLPPKNWGRVRPADPPFSVQVAPLARPSQSMVFTVHSDPPMAWIATFYPVDLAFVALGSGFPESDAFVARMRAMMAARQGPFYVMVDAAAAATPQVQNVLTRYGLRMSASTCTDYSSAIGRHRRDYALCVVTRVAP